MSADPTTHDRREAAKAFLADQLQGAVNDGLESCAKMARVMADRMDTGRLPKMDGPTALRLLADTFDKVRTE